MVERVCARTQLTGGVPTSEIDPIVYRETPPQLHHQSIGRGAGESHIGARYAHLQRTGDLLMAMRAFEVEEEDAPLRP